MRSNQLRVGIVVLLGAACGPAESGPVDGASGTTPPSERPEDGAYVRPAFECETLDYPCTYDEVDPRVMAASMALGIEADRRLLSSTTDAVAEWLSDQSEVVQVQFDETAIRFRVAEGRPLWAAKEAPTADPARSTPRVPHTHAPSMPYSGSVARPANGTAPLPPAVPALFETNSKSAKKRNGVRQDKSALILSPFKWEFKNDETDQLYEWLTDPNKSKAARQYTSVTLLQDSIYGGAPSVSIASFRNWDQYDLIHVSSHGQQACGVIGGSLAGPACATVVYTGALVSQGIPLTGAPQGSVVGEEWIAVIPTACSGLQVGDANYALYDCQHGQWWQGVTPDFFVDQGPPLENTLIFMSACESMTANDLARALAGPGSTFYGFTIAVPQADAPKIATVFYRVALQRGLPADRALTAAKTQGPGLSFFTGPGTPTRSPLAAPNQHGEMVRFGSPSLRAREVVSILDRTTENELQDDGIVTDVIGAPNDGKPDSVLVIAQVDGIDNTQDPANFTLEVQVDGAPAVSANLQTNPHPEVWQVEVTVPLGFDHDPQDRFDVEIRTDLEEGGTSQWRYERIRLGGCYWTLDLSGIAAAGRYTGVQATFLDMGQGMTLTLGGVDDETLISTLVMQNPPGIGAGPTPFPLGVDPNQDGGLFMNIPPTNGVVHLPFASGNSRPIRGDNPPRVIGIEPPPLDFTYTRLDQEWVEGHAYGTLFSVDLSGTRVHRASVQLHFRAKEALDLNSFLGSGGFPTSMPDPDPCNKHG